MGPKRRLPVCLVIDKAVHQKLRRLAAGNRPRVLDLFAGCGGISLGFLSAGFEIRAALEVDRDAARSHALNFHSGDEVHGTPRDITTTRPSALCSDLEVGPPATAFDVIVGGPPCQAFARVGRSKLREVADHPEAFRHDPRSRLYIDYLRYVDDCKPLAVVLENVPDMLNYGGHNIAQEVCEVLVSRGYTCAYTLLNAVNFGVPQMRERAFLVALRSELARPVRFPSPTHWIDLPSGYSGARAVALNVVATQAEPSFRFFQTPVAPHAALAPAVCAREALDDLPEIDARGELASGRLRRGARRFDNPIVSPAPKRPSVYARTMRQWCAFENNGYLSDHVIRYLPRDYPLFARLKPGDQYPEAKLEAKRMFSEAIEESRKSGRPICPGSATWTDLYRRIVPPYDHTKFPNKWRKMEPDKPARTLLAHLGKDGYSHIHYDSTQARTISVREAARLQSFPDGFRFCGTMNPAFRQIGNAVPPLLSRAIATVILTDLMPHSYVSDSSRPLNRV